MIKKELLNKRFSVPISERLEILKAQKGIRNEHIRAFIENFGNENSGKHFIKSSEWRRLKEIIKKVPSLIIIGVPNAGKTHMVSELVKNDKDSVYIILDSHSGYTFLPKIHEITPRITESSVLEMSKMDAAAGITFEMYKSLIQYNIYPANFVLIIDESIRYEDHGLDKMLAESRKFVKIVAITQRKLKGIDFIPEIFVENYNKINL